MGNDGHQAAAAATSQSQRPVADTDIRDVGLIAPTPTPPGLAGCAAASITVEPLDLGPMDVLCDCCGARHWLDERVSSSRTDSPKFEACCKQGDVVLPPFRQPPHFLRALLQDGTPSARQFRQSLRQYNAALSFTSLNCNVTDRGVRAGVNCFQVHGELYHLQGPLDPPPVRPHDTPSCTSTTRPTLRRPAYGLIPSWTVLSCRVFWICFVR